MALKLEALVPLLQVFDMPASIGFYRDVLDFKLSNTSGTPESGERFGWALLRRNHVELMLNTAYEDESRPPSPDPARTAAHSDTGLFFWCEDVDAAYRHLRDRGLDVKQPVVREYGMKQLYITDPDGYVLLSRGGRGVGGRPSIGCTSPMASVGPVRLAQNPLRRDELTDCNVISIRISK